MKKITLTESQYAKLVLYINEGNQPVLKNLLNDNKTANGIAFIIDDGSRISFKLHTQNGFKYIENVTPNTMNKGCIGDFRPDTMIYGDKVVINYTYKRTVDPTTKQPVFKDGTWKENLSGIRKVELYHDTNLIDSMELEDYDDTNQGMTIDQKVDDYNEQFLHLKVSQTFTITAKETYRGVLLIQKSGTKLQFEMNRITYEHDFENAGLFIIDDKGNISLKPTSLKGGGSRVVSIKNVTNLVIDPADKTPEEIEKEKTDKEAATQSANQKTADDHNKKTAEDLEKEKAYNKQIYDLIIKDPSLKKAFFHQPTLLGLVKSGDPVGIVPAKELVDSYMKKREEKAPNIKKKFPIDIDVMFQVVGSEYKVDVDGTDLVLDPTKNYVGKSIKLDNYSEGQVSLLCEDKSVVKEFKIDVFAPRTEQDTKDHIYPMKVKVARKTPNSDQMLGFYDSEWGKIKILKYNYNNT